MKANIYPRLFERMHRLTLGVLFLTLVYANSHASPPQDDKRMFRVEGSERVIDPEALRRQGLTGSVNIVVSLDNGQIEGQPRIDFDSPRTGKEAFAAEIQNIIQTWRFSDFGSGVIKYMVIVPPRSLGNPRIDIDLDGLGLENYEDYTVGLSTSQVTQLVASTLNAENINIIRKPQDVELPSAGGVDRIRVILLDNLQAFKWVFLVLTVLLLGTLATNIIKLFTKWAPKGEFTANPHGEVTKEDRHLNFKSPKAGEVRRLWLRAMELSSLEGSILKKLNFKEENFEERKARVKQLHNKLDECRSQEQVRSILKDEGLIEVAQAVQFEEKTNGEHVPRELPKVKQEAQNILSSLLEIDKTLSDKEAWFKLSEEEQREYAKKLFDYFGKPNIQKALAICETVNGNHQDGASQADKNGRTYPLFEIFSSGLHNHLINGNEWWASQEIDRSVDRTIETKIDERKGALDLLWALAGVCPMVGLLGTVVGISLAFGKIREIIDPRNLMQRLAGDINVALSTTIVGLILGLLSVVCYYILKYRFEILSDRIAQYFTNITNKI